MSLDVGSGTLAAERKRKTMGVASVNQDSSVVLPSSWQVASPRVFGAEN